jgi:hypothetical protein
MAAFYLDAGNRHANRIVNPRILADQPHGSGLRLVTVGGQRRPRQAMLDVDFYDAALQRTV